MTGAAVYNDNDAYACAWLENLVRAGCIAPGTVHAKSIVDVDGRDLAGAGQAHFFAGVGVWSAALRAAGWPDSRRVWTGSCPCQPFSMASHGKGFADKRHLWPAWFWLIEQHRPDVIFGEQVEGPAGRAWLDLVFTDLEAIGYTCGAVVFPAAGIGAPHIRHRFFFVANGATGWLADAAEPRWNELAVGDDRADGRSAEESGRLRAFGDWPGPVNGFWRASDWLYCRDDKWRPVEPGTFPLAHGAPTRVGRLRAYGNAIVLQQAQAFIEAFLEIKVV